MKSAAGDPVALDCLMGEVQHGDHKKFAEFYQSYFPVVLSRCLKHLGNEDDAIETTQEVFVYIYGCLETVTTTRTGNAWLMKIVHRFCLKKEMQQKEFVKYCIDEPLSAFTCLTDVSPESLFERKELEEILSSCIKNLPFSQRKVLCLHYGENLSPAEIAVQTNQKSSTVRKSLFDARHALRKDLKRCGYFCLQDNGGTSKRSLL